MEKARVCRELLRKFDCFSVFHPKKLNDTSSIADGCLYRDYLFLILCLLRFGCSGPLVSLAPRQSPHVLGGCTVAL